ncbi:MAG: IS256 family transposase [Acidimicrobiales bacterium]
MRRAPPSMRVREDLEQLLAGGVVEGTNIVSALVDTVTRLVVQEILEAEQADYLDGRGRYERRGPDQRGWRNGYEPGRIRSAEGAVAVRVPQVRGTEAPYRSTLMSFLEGNSEVLERLVTEMYAKGLSTRDVEDAFRDATGELLISKSAVSEITDQLWGDYQAFIARDLSDISVEYLFCDAIFESLRRQGAKEALLVAWCIDSEGRKHLLHLAVGNKESEAAWSDFFRNMIARGLRLPTTVTTDGAPGMIKAVDVVFARSIRIRCWFHLYRVPGYVDCRLDERCRAYSRTCRMLNHCKHSGVLARAGWREMKLWCRLFAQVVAGGIQTSPRNNRASTSSAPTSCLRAVAR